MSFYLEMDDLQFVPIRTDRTLTTFTRNILYLLEEKKKKSPASLQRFRSVAYIYAK